MKAATAVAALGALAQEIRLAVFRTLVQAGPSGLSAGAIAERLDLASPTLSFHLAQLKHAGLVSCRRESRSLIYTAEYDSMAALVGFLTENCCAGADASCGSSRPPLPKLVRRTKKIGR